MDGEMEGRMNDVPFRSLSSPHGTAADGVLLCLPRKGCHPLLTGLHSPIKREMPVEGLNESGPAPDNPPSPRPEQLAQESPGPGWPISLSWDSHLWIF